MNKIIQKCKKVFYAQQDKTHHANLNAIWKNPLHLIACGFGIGLLPAPGTFGTLIGIVVTLLIYPLPLWSYLLITIFLNLIGIYLCGKINKDFGTEDHPAAIWDEIAAFPIVMIAICTVWLCIGLYELVCVLVKPLYRYYLKALRMDYRSF